MSLSAQFSTCSHKQGFQASHFLPAHELVAHGLFIPNCGCKNIIKLLTCFAVNLYLVVTTPKSYPLTASPDSPFGSLCRLSPAFTCFAVRPCVITSHPLIFKLLLILLPDCSIGINLLRKYNDSDASGAYFVLF